MLAYCLLVGAERYSFRVIGRVESPYTDKASVPRQPSEAREARGRIVLDPALADGLDSLASFSHVWVVFVFHQAGESARLKVAPPRSAERRGVFATRSPHRPNPIGLSVVRLLAIRDSALEVEGLDMVDGTPVLDLKPYLPYADALPDAGSGWVAAPRDPGPRWQVAWAPEAGEAARWIEAESGSAVRAPVETLLATGPEPRAYRRIKRDAAGARIAYKSWRFWFEVEGAGALRVVRLRSGFKPSELAGSAERGDGLDRLGLHRAFTERFP